MTTTLKGRVDSLIERIKSDWSEEDLALAKGVAEDWTMLMQRRLAGEDVNTELEIVKAQAKNITAGSLSTLHVELGRQLRKFLSELIKELVPGI